MINDADDFIMLHFKPGSWKSKGLPEHGCRIRTSAFEAIIEGGGTLEIEDLIAGLTDWLKVADDPEDGSLVLQSLLERHYPTTMLIQ